MKFNLRIFTLNALIIITTLYLFALLPAVGMAPMSVMAFDSGESTEAWIFVGIMFSLPVMLLLGIIIPWFLFIIKRYKIALLFTFLPLLNLLALLVLFALMG